ncbi:U3 small nucleolar ribonucleoprotein protein MPP10 [Geodia barretti]|uniref:U3 small nucleolar ribonucleoprotein protein MPP10 n=1 Tax=Geodia barretti TaxID=519541 RepID=A0AA35W1I7_GEOBA|nr:U3 small nucleolar ribonucleoprotein protein MPP10 [Geodia barretti]
MDVGDRDATKIANRVLNKFRRELSAPELYLEPSQSLQSGCLSGVEHLFRCLRQSAGHLPVGPLQRLYTADFDEEQVWEEVQLTNEPALVSLSRVVGRLRPGMQLVTRKLEKEEEEEEEEEGQEEAEKDAGEVERDEEEKDEGDNEESAQEAQKVEKCHKPRVDDGFFSMSAMEEYLENADKLSDPGSEGSVGMLAEELSESDSNQLVYQDFFDPPLTVGTREKDSDISKYEREKEKMAWQIQRIEEANVQPKSWQMSGEASSRDRPLNSLLEEAMDFEPMSVPAPVVSEDTTQSLEDIVRQRILDQVCTSGNLSRGWGPRSIAGMG